MATDAEISSNIKNGLLSTRKNGTERKEYFMKKRLLYREVSFYDPIQRSTIETSFKKKKHRKVISFFKENRQTLELFVEKYPERHEAFKYPLTTFKLAISSNEGKLYQPKTKYHFKDDFIELYRTPKTVK